MRAVQRPLLRAEQQVIAVEGGERLHPLRLVGHASDVDERAEVLVGRGEDLVQRRALDHAVEAGRDRLLVALQLRQLLVEGGELVADLREPGRRRIRVFDEIGREVRDRSLGAGLRQLRRDRAGDGALRLCRARRGARDDAEHQDHGKDEQMTKLQGNSSAGS